MWDCEACGCRNIGHGLGFCPMCGTERDVAKISKLGGATDAWQQVDAPADDAKGAADNTKAADPKADDAKGSSDGSGAALSFHGEVQVDSDAGKGAADNTKADTSKSDTSKSDGTAKK